ncbi:hypothetical protein J484_1432 [Acinetobacter baumannii 1051830]|nr:hypothetical protein J484_1432 [Acinetobacter baumannii 1051830]
MNNNGGFHPLRLNGEWLSVDPVEIGIVIVVQVQRQMQYKLPDRFAV